jgi:hypothetical protein
MPAWLAGRRQKRLVDAIDTEVTQRIQGRLSALQDTKTPKGINNTPKCLIDRMLLGYKKDGKALDELASKIILEK